MKNRLFKGVAAIVLAASLAFGSVAVPVIPQTAAVVEAKTSAKTVTKNLALKVGETINLKTKKYVTGTIKGTPKTSKNAVATVSKKGVISVLKNGTAKITVKNSAGKTFVFNITASAPKISVKSKTLNVGKTLTLSVSKATNVKWSSSNTKVATVNKKGKVTAKKAGNATITAKAGSMKFTCKITVKKATAFKQPTIKYSTVDRQASRGRDMIDEKINKAVIKFDQLPKNVSDLKKISFKDGKGSEKDGKQDGKYLVVACTLAAIAAFTEGRESDGQAMLNYLMNSPHYGSHILGADRYPITQPSEPLNPEVYPWAFFDGATPYNGHKPNKPLSVTLEEGVYAPKAFNEWDYKLYYEEIYFHIDDHPCQSNTLKILVYKDPATDRWYLKPDGFISLYHGGSVR